MPADWPFPPPVTPMEAEVADELPPPPGWAYEPKWDGFRVVMWSGTRCTEAAAGAGPGGPRLDSRNAKPLLRYFPELEPGLACLPSGTVVDGEVVVIVGGKLDFDALQNRIHPAESRVGRLAEETPAHLALFDLLALRGEDLRARPFPRTSGQAGGIGSAPRGGLRSARSRRGRFGRHGGGRCRPSGRSDRLPRRRRSPWPRIPLAPLTQHHRYGTRPSMVPRLRVGRFRRHRGQGSRPPVRGGCAGDDQGQAPPHRGLRGGRIPAAQGQKACRLHSPRSVQPGRRAAFHRPLLVVQRGPGGRAVGGAGVSTVGARRPCRRRLRRARSPPRRRQPLDGRERPSISSPSGRSWWSKSATTN